MCDGADTRETFIRTEALLGSEAMERLRNSRVIIFGIGGVGSYAAEAIVRSGVGRVTFVDPDTVSVSNINRQLIALHSTVGMNKAEVMRRRALDINPACEAEALDMFYAEANAESIDFAKYDCVVDAIDTVSSKLLIIERAKRAGTRVISAMGAGNKLDPSQFEAADIFSTSVCPLARVMRTELKKRGINKLRVVYSREQPLVPNKLPGMENEASRRSTPGSTAFAPSAAGLVLAGEVVRSLAFSTEL